MQDTTFCLLTRPGEVLLSMKKRGFGTGKWNGFGGKVATGETILAAACRETQEEGGILVREEDLELRGVIEFFMPPESKWNQRMHVFITRAWEGEPEETEEMRPVWHANDAIPYDAMWVADRHWLPLVLAGKSIRATFQFAPGRDNALDVINVQEI